MKISIKPQQFHGYNVGEGIYQFLGQSDRPIPRKIADRGKFGIFSTILGFPIHFAIPPLTFQVTKCQLFGVERSLSPFWKLER